MEMRFYETKHPDGSITSQLQYKTEYDWKNVPTVRSKSPNETFGASFGMGY